MVLRKLREVLGGAEAKPLVSFRSLACVVNFAQLFRYSFYCW